MGTLRGARRLTSFRIIVTAAVASLGLQLATMNGADRGPPAPAARAPVQDLGPASSEAHARFQQAVWMLHARRFEYAIVALQRVDELVPRLPAVHANLGFAYAGLQQWNLAYAEFSRALEIQPRQVNAYYGLALAADALGDRAAAIGAMRAFVHLAAPDERFLAKARAALWEWQAEPSPTDFELETTSGGRLRTSDWRGRVAIVNIWALWCEPCRRELPALQKLADRLDDRRFVLATVAAQSDEFSTREWLRSRSVSLATGLDPQGGTTRAQLGVGSYPTTLILDASGQVVLRLVGVQDWSDPRLRTRLEALATDHVRPENLQTVAGRTP